jgi:hypothetical protein
MVTRFPARIQFVLDDGHWMTGQNLCPVPSDPSHRQAADLGWLRLSGKAGV